MKMQDPLVCGNDICCHCAQTGTTGSLPGKHAMEAGSTRTRSNAAWIKILLTEVIPTDVGVSIAAVLTLHIHPPLNPAGIYKSNLTDAHAQTNEEKCPFSALSVLYQCYDTSH